MIAAAARHHRRRGLEFGLGRTGHQPRNWRPATLTGRRAKQTLLDTLPNLDDHRFEDGYRTMDVGSWLRSLGLGQYETNFRDNKIDADLLPRLTVDDLKDIGVSVVGDRRRLLDAIAY
jgi:SAM domain (Sterile alpha motif)